MEFNYISLLSPVPEGFQFEKDLNFKQLRRQIFCLLCEKNPFEDQTLLEKLTGLVILPGKQFTSRKLAPELMEWTVPEASLSNLKAWAAPLLELLKNNRDHRENAQISQLEAQRAVRDRSELVKEHQIFREQLIQENLERRHSEAALAKSEEKLHQSEKMRLVGQLAGGIAHDFNNRLTCIMVASELLESNFEADPENQTLIRMVIDSAQRAAELTEKLLTFARKQPTHSDRMDLHQTLQETVSLLSNTISRSIEIDLELRAKESIILGDYSQLQSAFLNLGINASHAMPEGGRLRISSQITELNEKACHHSLFELKPGKFIEIKFEDTGCGIAPELLERIFEPFFTTKDPGKGTGLGLAVVLGTVQEHQGAIKVESKLNQGTRFRLYFPLIESAYEPPIQTDYKRLQGKGRILIIDDEFILRESLRTLLIGLGYEVLCAENGSEGLELFRAAPESIDLVLLDRVMPVMDGKKTFYALRDVRPDLKIVLSSGNMDPFELEQMFSDGLSFFIQKPFQSAQLSHVLAKILNPTGKEAVQST